MLWRWLTHPLLRDRDGNDPDTVPVQRRIVREKPFLRRLYAEWYELIAEELPQGEGPVLELGSGPGFMKEFIPGLITSDLVRREWLDRVVDAQELPFPDASLRAIVMTDVLHHIPRPRRFLREAARCVRVGGAVVMVEPWVSPWSRVVYGRLHAEPLRPKARSWSLPSNGPLSEANIALPWIIFKRDRERFERELPQWATESIQLLMPFRYLLSGGARARSLAPGWSFGPWRAVERLLQPLMPLLAMFAKIVLQRVERAGEGAQA